MASEAIYISHLEDENKRLKETMEEVIKSPQWRHVPNWVVIKLEQALKDPPVRDSDKEYEEYQRTREDISDE